MDRPSVPCAAGRRVRGVRDVAPSGIVEGEGHGLCACTVYRLFHRECQVTHWKRHKVLCDLVHKSLNL